MTSNPTGYKPPRGYPGYKGTLIHDQGRVIADYMNRWRAVAGNSFKPSAVMDCEKLKQRAITSALPVLDISEPTKRGRPATTHCSKGHERTEENTYWANNTKKGWVRQCRPCQMERRLT